MPVPGMYRTQPKDDEPKILAHIGGQLIEVNPDFATVDQDPTTVDEPPEPTWQLALNDPILFYRDGQNQRLDRDTTHLYIGLLEAKRQELETIEPILKQQLEEATAQVETNKARLEAAWQAVVNVVVDAQRRSAQITDFGAPRVADPPIRYADCSPHVFLTDRNTRLGETQEYLAHNALRRRIHDDPRAPENKVLRRQSFLSVQVSACAPWISTLNTRIFELRNNLVILDEQDERADPNSAWSRRRQQRIEEMEAKVRRGEILAYHLVS